MHCLAIEAELLLVIPTNLVDYNNVASSVQHTAAAVLQAQDRCHRIGQTREVHIYRLVSEKTIEENILTKSDQKRQLDHLAIQSGGFNTEFLQKFNPRELLGVQPGGEQGSVLGESMLHLLC